MKCKPLNFKGTERVVELTQWFEKMETVFRISICFVKNQIKFSTCTLLGSALTWWNSHVTTVGPDAAYEMTWVDMKNKMTDKYCPRGEMKKLESELWNLRVKNMKKKMTDKYCPRGEIKKLESELWNLRKSYGGSKPLCPKCNYHHDGLCASKCFKCNKVGHFARDCRSTTNTNNAKNQKGTGSGQKPTCYECGVQGHFKRECPKLRNNNNHGNQGRRDNAPAKKTICYEYGVQGHFKRERPKLKNNNDHGNQGERNNAPARVYAVGRAGTDPDTNVVMERLIENLCTIWIGRLCLHANVVRFQRDHINNVSQPKNNDSQPNKTHVDYVKNMGAEKSSFADVLNFGRVYPSKVDVTSPAVVLDDACLMERDFSSSLMRKIKDINAIPNLYLILTNEGFENVKL
nr:hypothetical protein [Tanacetum cinerariifolium]